MLSYYNNMSNVTYSLLNALPVNGVWDISTNYFKSDYFKLGIQAGETNQGANCIAIGSQAGQITQGYNSVAIGPGAGCNYQRATCIAIGDSTGFYSQGTGSVAIGTLAGQVNQGNQNNTGDGYAIAIGYNAGSNTQSQYAVAVGYGAGATTQGLEALAIGREAGGAGQGAYSVALGSSAGGANQSNGAIAIGYGAAFRSQGYGAIAIGYSAGAYTQATGAIAIGYNAGNTGQHSGSLIINASSDYTYYLNSATQNACYINPIRQNASALNTLGYNATTKEIVYQGNPVIEALNFSNYGQTVKSLSVTYTDNTVVKTSGINVNLDSSIIDYTQTYTFGPNLQARYVACGTNATSGAAPTSTIFYSSDGTNWIASPYTGFNNIGGVVNGVAYNGSIWVAVGASATAPATTVIFSYDGISWTAASGTTFGSTSGAQGRCVFWGGNKFVAVGTSGGTAPTTTAIYSYDGINWQVTATTGSTTGMWSTATYSGSGWGVAYNGDIWVAVGSDGNTTLAPFTNCKCIYYSSDGITWTNATSGSPFFTQSGTGAIARAVAWNGIKWIAVGTDSTSTAAGQNASRSAFSSTDGITWTVISQNIFGANQSANLGGWCIAWNGVRWVTGGTLRFTSGSMFYSTDGITWTVCTGDTFNINADGFCRGVSWNGYKWIATGVSGSSASLLRTMSYSYDGIQWIGTSVNVFGTNTASSGYGLLYNSLRPNSITFPRNVVVAGGPYGSGLATTIAYSLDNGTTWVACQNAIFGTTGGTSVCFCVATNGNIWVAGGSGSTTLGYSFNGIVWTAVPNAISIFSTNVKGIAWSPVLELWVAVGSGTNQLAYSYDGITWTGVTLPSSGFTNSVGFDVAWGEDKFVAAGGNTSTNTRKLFYSYDGKTWSLVTTQPGFTLGAYGIGYNGTMWVAVGSNAVATATFPYYSYDGITWIVGAGASFSNNDTNGNGAVAWSGYRWVVTTGTLNATATLTPILYSNDGINWTAAVTPANCAGCGMVWVGNRFIAGMSIPALAVQIYTSPDGVTWSLATTNAFGSQCNAFAWSSNLPNSGIQNVNVAIQQPTLAFGSGTNTIAYSYDGISWRGLGSSVFTSTGYCGCWNGTLWVAGGVSSGVGVLAYSYDGINWTVASQSILSTIVYSVAWNGTLFVAVGQGASTAIAYSYDGIFWQTSSSAAAVGFTTAYCVAWGQKYFVVGSGGSGATNNIAYSTDGINWTGAIVTGTTAAYIFRGVVCGGSLWVIVGNNGGTTSAGYWATIPSGTWTSGTGFTGGTVNLLACVTFGIYPVSSSAAGTTYGTIFCAGGVTASPASSAYVYSTDGKTWSASASGNTAFNNLQLNSLVWNGKRFIGISIASTRIAYSYDAQTWYSVSSIPNVVQPAQLFTTDGYGLASSAWPTLGSVYVDNAVTISQNSGLNTTKQLDVYSDTYFNNGYNNAIFTIKSNSIP